MDEEAFVRMPWAKDSPLELSSLLSREWLVTNGLGGYASGTVAGACTRRFHGLLVAALPAPLGRIMVLNHLSEELRLPDGSFVRLGGDEVAEGALQVHGGKALSEFRLDQGLPVWRYEVQGAVLEKSIVLPHLQNTVFIRYRMLKGEGLIRLRMRPSIHFRRHEGRVDAPLDGPYAVRCWGCHYQVETKDDHPPLRLLHYGEKASFVLDGGKFREIFYRVEQSRGYDARGRLWSPGYLRADLTRGGEATLGASTEPWEIFAAMSPQDAFENEKLRRARLLNLSHPKARSGPAAELVHATDKFIITPNSRVADAARTRASGDDIRSVIAGYHWFTDWGRDTMISLEGLTLITGRYAEAGWILKMFARHIREGLIPNLFPEGRQEGVYHTADATLWFFHALERYLLHTNDHLTLALLLPQLIEVLDRHLKGTLFGISVDPADGMLRQGAPGYQLTWMDAKVDDWVVTPRRGKAVEINALWYNALRTMENWMRRESGEKAAKPYGELAARVKESFNRRFWNEQGWLFDVVDPEDPQDLTTLRPNQIFAVSLPHAVLDPARWKAVVEVVQRELVTPVGLRSLARGHPSYRSRYDGDLRSRDAAYHQGTVWAYLIGPFVDAWLKVHPEDKAGGRRFLEGLLPHFNEACLGSISEIFDADPPFYPRGCVAQAWSVAEVLRAWVKTG